MNQHPMTDVRVMLRIWQSRQQADGCLAAVLLAASSIPVLRFLFAPSPASAWVMGVFLLALGMACLRLLNAAAMVVSIRQSMHPHLVPEIVEAEILDVYEHPGGIDFPTTQTTNALWLANPGTYRHDGRSELSLPEQSSAGLLHIDDSSLLHVRRSGRG